MTITRITDKSQKFVISLFLIFLGFISYGQGIIIADDIRQKEIFSTPNSEKILQFANEISKDYKKVILHLGRSYVFDKGNIFSSATSKSNLKIFSEQLFKNDVELILWFFDSYGSKSFLNIYKEHKSIINQNIDSLKSLKIIYNGIAVDLEWINSPASYNNDKYITILADLRKKIPDKKIFCFASLLNNPSANSDRGYDSRNILKFADNIIDLLYLQDAGFFVFSNRDKPILNKERINDLQNYFKERGWLIAMSLASGLVTSNPSGSGFTIVNDFAEGNFNSLFNYSKLKYKYSNGISTVFEYKVKTHKRFLLKNGETIRFRKRQRVFYFELNPQSLTKDFIWEYFLLRDEHKEH
ncbi:MAG: hypothetical protein NVS3B19_18260 [Ginsengibacter sp.]